MNSWQELCKRRVTWLLLFCSERAPALGGPTEVAVAGARTGMPVSFPAQAVSCLENLGGSGAKVHDPSLIPGTQVV